MENPLFNTLCEIEGINPHACTKSEAGRVAKSLKEIKVAFPELTPEELLRRRNNYLTWWPDMKCTARALAGHWSQCDKPNPASSPIRPHNPNHRPQTWTPLMR